MPLSLIIIDYYAIYNSPDIGENIRQIYRSIYTKCICPIVAKQFNYRVYSMMMDRMFYCFKIENNQRTALEISIFAYRPQMMADASCDSFSPRPSTSTKDFYG